MIDAHVLQEKVPAYALTPSCSASSLGNIHINIKWTQTKFLSGLGGISGEKG